MAGSSTLTCWWAAGSAMCPHPHPQPSPPPSPPTSPSPPHPHPHPGLPAQRRARAHVGRLVVYPGSPAARRLLCAARRRAAPPALRRSKHLPTGAQTDGLFTPASRTAPASGRRLPRQLYDGTPHRAGHVGRHPLRRLLSTLRAALQARRADGPTSLDAQPWLDWSGLPSRRRRRRRRRGGRQAPCTRCAASRRRRTCAPSAAPGSQRGEETHELEKQLSAANYDYLQKPRPPSPSTALAELFRLDPTIARDALEACGGDSDRAASALLGVGS